MEGVEVISMFKGWSSSESLGTIRDLGDVRKRGEAVRQEERLVRLPRRGKRGFSLQDSQSFGRTNLRV